MNATKPALTIAQAEAFFRNGGTVTRHYRNMPAVFETPAGVVTRQAVNVLYRDGKLSVRPAGRFGATYAYAA